jgi:tRNA threonylcarbamoyladenosine biosynthesis protein TsaB
MARIISLETASTNCSVSVYQGSELLAIKEDPSPDYTHGELLHVFMDEAMREAGLHWADLEAVAVSKGPGSYTGLRIGVAAAKGLCFALDIPLIAVETLKSMAFQLKGAEGVLIPMLDARRMEAYVAVFDAEHKQIGPTRAEIISGDSFSKWTSQGPVHLLGNGAEKCREVLTHPNFHFHTALLPGSREIGLLANDRFQKERFEDVAYFEPFYLKDFILQKKKPKN